MINYKTWKKLLSENIGGSSIIGFGSPNHIAVINGISSTPVTTEAGKMPFPEEPEGEMDDDDVEDGMEDDGDDDSDEEPEVKKSKKSKCGCDCDCEKCAGKKDESFGLTSVFCTCGSPSVKDGTCGVCNKYALEESYNNDRLVDDSLKFYRGENSDLYKVASYASQRYTPAKSICESAKVEITDIFKNTKDISDRKSLAHLYLKIDSVHQK